MFSESGIFLVSAVGHPRWDPIRYADGGEELYDHYKGPHKWHNLAGEEGMDTVKHELAKWFPKQNAEPARATPSGPKKEKGKGAKKKQHAPSGKGVLRDTSLRDPHRQTEPASP